MPIVRPVPLANVVIQSNPKNVVPIVLVKGLRLSTPAIRQKYAGVALAGSRRPSLDFRAAEAIGATTMKEKGRAGSQLAQLRDLKKKSETTKDKVETRDNKIVELMREIDASENRRKEIRAKLETLTSDGSSEASSDAASSSSDAAAVPKKRQPVGNTTYNSRLKPPGGPANTALQQVRVQGTTHSSGAVDRMRDLCSSMRTGGGPPGVYYRGKHELIRQRPTLITSR